MRSATILAGTPKARIVHRQSGELADLLVNEVALAYHVPMKNVRRSVLFVRDPGYFVVVDRVEAVWSRHKYSWRIHLNNRDEQGVLEERGLGHWHFTRPLANLGIYLFSDQNYETKIGEGYMHGPGRDYSPGGVYEGKPGSSIELEAFNPEKVSAVTYYSVLFPMHKDQEAPVVEYSPDHLTVGDDIFSFKGGLCDLQQKQQSETYRILTSFENIEFQQQIEIYPNPAGDKLNIRGIKAGHRIRIYNAAGVVIRDIKAQRNFEVLPVDNIPAGIILIEISINNRVLGSFKAIKK